MDVSTVDGFGRLFGLIEIIFVMVVPFVTWYLGYRMGWKEAKEQSFRKTRAYHQNKLWY